MSEAAARFRQPIDLDEFERRLRADNNTTEPANKEDPLAELARLVGQHDPFRSVPQLRPAAVARGSRERSQVPHLQQVHPPLDRHDPPFGDSGSAAVAADEMDVGRATQPALFAHLDHQVEPADADDHRFDQVVAAASMPSAEFPPADELPPAAVFAASDGPRRSWRGVIILSTILATGFGGLALALTMKHTTSASVAAKGSNALGGLPVILAGGPTKVQPPKAAADTPDEQPSVLDKSAPAKPTKAKLVDNVERPVDLSQQPQTRPAPPSALAVTGATDRAINAQTTAANVDSLAASPPPPRQLASLDPSSASPASLAGSSPPLRSAAPAPRDDADNRPPPGLNGFPSPKRVKIVSVRPDGSIIGTENDPPPAAVSAPVAAAPEPSPQVELGVAMPRAADSTAPPPASKPGANAARRQAVEEQGSGNAKRSNDPVAALIDQPRGDRKASTRTESTDNAAASDTDPAPASKSKRGKKKNKVQTAELENQDANAAASEGTFAAQLAASPSESAARATMRKLQRKYGSSFSGHKLSYRRVRVDGKTVYRVRLTGLSKSDAGSMCDKLQSDGGTCFVANN